MPAVIKLLPQEMTRLRDLIVVAAVVVASLVPLSAVVACTISSVQLPSSSVGFMTAAVGDLDNDGVADIVASLDASPSFGLLVYKGISASSFASPISTGSTPCLSDVVISDLDYDGLPDIMTQMWVQTWYRNLGSFTFGSAASLATGFPYCGGYDGMFLGDCNNDGKLDAFFQSGATVGIAIRLSGSAFGAFSGIVQLPSAADWSAIAIGDIDSDGNLDLVVYDELLMKWFRGSGSCSFTLVSPPVTVSTTNRAQGVYVADINGDGWLDIIASAASVVYWQQYNSTSGGLGPFQVLISNVGTGAASALNANGDESLAIADIDGDGAPDIVAIRNVESTNNLVWFRNTGGATFSAATIVGSVTGIFGVVVGDIDGDGWPEIVALSSSSGVYVFSCIQTRTACAPGRYCNGGTYSCPRGSVCPAGSTTPSNCPAGYFCNATKLSMPTAQCPIGYQCPSGSIVPTYCAGGTYCPRMRTAQAASCWVLLFGRPFVARDVSRWNAVSCRVQ